MKQYLDGGRIFLAATPLVEKLLKDGSARISDFEHRQEEVFDILRQSGLYLDKYVPYVDCILYMVSSKMQHMGLVRITDLGERDQLMELTDEGRRHFEAGGRVEMIGDEIYCRRVER